MVGQRISSYICAKSHPYSVNSFFARDRLVHLFFINFCTYNKCKINDPVWGYTNRGISGVSEVQKCFRQLRFWHIGDSFHRRPHLSLNIRRDTIEAKIGCIRNKKKDFNIKDVVRSTASILLGSASLQPSWFCTPWSKNQLILLYELMVDPWSGVITTTRRSTNVDIVRVISFVDVIQWRGST